MPYSGAQQSNELSFLVVAHFYSFVSLKEKWNHIKTLLLLTVRKIRLKCDEIHFKRWLKLNRPLFQFEINFILKQSINPMQCYVVDITVLIKQTKFLGMKAFVRKHIFSFILHWKRLFVVFFSLIFFSLQFIRTLFIWFSGRKFSLIRNVTFFAVEMFTPWSAIHNLDPHAMYQFDSKRKENIFNKWARDLIIYIYICGKMKPLNILCSANTYKNTAMVEKYARAYRNNARFCIDNLSIHASTE